MDENIKTIASVSEEGFLIEIVRRVDLNVVQVYGAYDNFIALRGNDTILTDTVLNDFYIQSGVENITTSYRGSYASWIFKIKEGSNFFELDFSELNKELDGTEHSQFRW